MPFWDRSQKVMDEHFDRAPGAGRSRNLATEPGFAGCAGETETKSALFNQREPLRQPRTGPPFADNSINAANEIGTRGRGPDQSLVAEILKLMAHFRNDSMRIGNTRHTRELCGCG